MKGKQVKWNLPGLGKGIDPKKVVKEFDRIKNVYGGLTAANVLSEAEKPDNLLHTLFEWDDSKAAQSWRLRQAQTVINNIVITVVHDGEKRDIGAYEIVTTSGQREYKSVDSFTKEDIEEVKRTVLAELGYLKAKMYFYSDLKPTIEHITKAQESLV